MKRLLLLLIPLLFLVLPGRVSAQSTDCSVSVTPSSGINGTTFSFAIHCPPAYYIDTSNQEYDLVITNVSGGQTQVIGGIIIWPCDVNGQNCGQGTLNNNVIPTFTPNATSWPMGISRAVLTRANNPSATISSVAQFTFGACGYQNGPCCSTGDRCGGALSNLTCIQNICQVCGGLDQYCCGETGQSPCGASASLFCNTALSPARCNQSTIPAGCTPAFQVCNGTRCTNNPLYCCTDASSCDDIVAPQPPPPSGPNPHGTCGNSGIQTALGCLDITGTNTIATLLTWGTGIAGGIAVLMIIFAGFQITTAGGDPKRVKAGQELVTSAIAGLFLIALSVILLNFIGVNVFGLQDLGFSF